MTDPCGCIVCTDERERARPEPRPFYLAGWPRYACETCGNKRCPHHTDHRLACTGSNEPGQPGSVYA